jgi:nicotinic acid phosphoribosyltransferase
VFSIPFCPLPHKAPPAALLLLQLWEFGLRRAQGPDGAMAGTQYAYVGGFDGTSNVLAGQRLGIPISGTHAHAFVQSYQVKGGGSL